MTGLFSSIFFDLLLFSGILSLLLSPLEKFKEYRKVMIPLGIILVIIGLVFFDWNAAQNAFWEGYNSAN